MFVYSNFAGVIPSWNGQVALGQFAQCPRLTVFMCILLRAKTSAPFGGVSFDITLLARSLFFGTDKIDPQVLHRF